MKVKKVVPFLKWPGGKRWLMANYGSYFPSEFNTYFEPFLGGGAAFFFLQPDKAVLSDINGELIGLYSIMRDKPAELAELLTSHQAKHSNEYYYAIRDTEFCDPLQSAARLLYLNRMCFNGMYRVNKSGKFNVPIGTKSNCVYDIDLFKDYSAVLKNAELLQSDFATTICRAKENDLIFADPPYTISDKQSSFIKYNDHLFTWQDQKRLFHALYDAKLRGSYILSTNACFEDLKQLYVSSGFYVKVVHHHSLISGKAEKRRVQDELLISSYPLRENKEVFNKDEDSTDK